MPYYEHILKTVDVFEVKYLTTFTENIKNNRDYEAFNTHF